MALLQLSGALCLVAIVAVAVLLPRFISSGMPQDASPIAGAQRDPSASMSVTLVPTDVAAAPSLPAGASRCLTAWATEDRVATTIHDELAHSDGLVVGTITSVGQGQMASVPGGRVPGPPDVYTPVTLKITTVARASALAPSLNTIGGSIVVRMRGGTIGCSTYRIQDYPIPTVGNGVALFLYPGLPPQLKSAPHVDFDVLDEWSVQNGVVASPDGERYTLAELVSASAQ